MASGDSLFERDAQSSFPPASAAATPDVRNQAPVLDFDAAADEAAYVRLTLPRHYAAGGITVSLRWAASTATSGVCRWGLALERLQDDVDDVDSHSFATEKTVDATAASASGELAYDEIAFLDSEIDGLLAGEEALLRVRRLGTHANDTMAGDAELFALEARES